MILTFKILQGLDGIPKDEFLLLTQMLPEVMV